MSETSAEKTKSLVEIMETTDGQAIGLTKASEIAGKGSEIKFTFEYLGFLFAVKAKNRQQKTVMRMHANLGNIPYTVEGGGRRSNALEILGAATIHLGGRVSISNHQRILLQEEYTFDEPLTPVMLITKATTLMVRAKPFLELMARVITPPLMVQARGGS